MNTKELYGKGYTYKVTRRTVTRDGRSYVRVRVQAWHGLVPSGKPEMNEFKDYGPGEWHTGNATFFKQIETVQRHING